MRVLVTGHRGYIGSVMTCVLRHARFDVVGLDCDWYSGCDFGRVVEPVPSFDTDIRDVEFTDLLSFDAVVHLAALPEHASGHHGRGAGRRQAVSIDEIDYEATMHLAECAKQANVPRFVFASSWSVYGRNGTERLDETSPPNPVTAHGKSKLHCERDLARLADMAFTPVFLRNAEVYGVSPRLRMDLIVNDFVGSAVTHGRVEFRGGAGGWRSLVHVEDLCRAYAAVLTAPDDLVRSEVFNVTAPDADYRVIDVADAVTEMVPSCTRPLTVDLFDGKSVRTDGSKLRRRFPKLSFRWTLPLGIRQLQNAMVGAGVSPGDWRSDRYRRARRLQNLIDSGELDPSLRRPEAALIS